MSRGINVTRQTNRPVSAADTAAVSTAPGFPARPRFLSPAECQALQQRAERFAHGGGDTRVAVESRWTGNLRWARNQIISSGDVQDNDLWVMRTIRGAMAMVQANATADADLAAAVQRAEFLLQFESETGDYTLHDDYQEPYLHPTLFFDTTYTLDAAHRAAVMQTVVPPAVQAGMQAAGYLEVSAYGRSITTSRGQMWYYPYTHAQYSVTVRDPKGTGSGWAGVDWNDWTRIDAAQLTAVAVDKCVTSRNPVAIEPGRYTTILEPQAVCDLFSVALDPDLLDRERAEDGLPPTPYHIPKSKGQTKIGQQLLDARLTVSADPMDPDLGFPPFSLSGAVYHPVVWFERGVLKNLAYDREYGVKAFLQNTGLPASGAYRMSGGATPIADMIATTKRGVLVTRFSDVQLLDPESLLCTGYTRDGLWLIEDGKISKPVKNFRFTESPLIVGNQIELLGVPQRVFHPKAPVIVPSMKVHDFSFTALSDAI